MDSKIYFEMDHEYYYKYIDRPCSKITKINLKPTLVFFVMHVYFIIFSSSIIDSCECTCNSTDNSNILADRDRNRAASPSSAIRRSTTLCSTTGRHVRSSTTWSPIRLSWGEAANWPGHSGVPFRIGAKSTCLCGCAWRVTSVFTTSGDGWAFWGGRSYSRSCRGWNGVSIAKENKQVFKSQKILDLHALTLGNRYKWRHF